MRTHMRVYEVARAIFGPHASNREMIDAGVPYGVKSHSSSVTLQQARELRQQFRQRLAPRRLRREAWRQASWPIEWKEFSLQ